MSKELEDLLRRVSELEKQVKNGSFSAFGRSYSSIGSSSSDFVIKTKGQVKIQWGNKFIDLIKDGKINVNSKFIFTVDTSDDIGSRDGLYVTDDGSVYLKSGNTVINLVGEIGTVYVSFMEEQETTSDQKYTALKNIGFIYDTLQDVNESALQNGLIYVQQEHKIYLVSNGQLQEFSIEIPNPFTQQFVVQKSDPSKGAILIMGSGIENSLAFESLYLYTSDGEAFINSDGNITFIIGSDNILQMTRDRTTIYNITQSNMFQSIGADANTGFRLYIENGTSTLEVDNIIERNGDDPVRTNVFPEFFSKKNNVIVRAEQASSPDYGEGFALHLKYENQYKVGDCLYTFGEIQVDDFRTRLIKIPFTIGMLNTESGNIIYVQVIQGYSEEVDSLTELPDLVGKIVFLVSTDEQVSQLRYSENNVDLLQYTQFEEEQNVSSVKARVGNLTELELKGKDNGQEVPIEGLGVFAENGAFKQAQYKSDYFLDDVDNSSKFASTEWVNKLLPKGTIVMFNGLVADIPKNWAICDGSNGTPNLIDKFVKGGSSSGATGGELEVTLTKENLPAHTHTVQSGTVTTSSAGLHRHSIGYTNGDLGDNANNRNNILGSSTTYTGYDGQHTHTVDLSKITLSTEGEGKPIKIEPPYYTLIYIMKIV